ncbi:hypothetical protein MRB53_039666 [Persea americana]|nr:hypothetical protein MRB53_039666 [Persea americana]
MWDSLLLSKAIIQAYDGINGDVSSFADVLDPLVRDFELVAKNFPQHVFEAKSVSLDKLTNMYDMIYLMICAFMAVTISASALPHRAQDLLTRDTSLEEIFASPQQSYQSHLSRSLEFLAAEPIHSVMGCLDDEPIENQLICCRECHYGPENSGCATFNSPDFITTYREYVNKVYKDLYDVDLPCETVDLPQKAKQQFLRLEHTLTNVEPTKKGDVDFSLEQKIVCYVTSRKDASWSRLEVRIQMLRDELFQKATPTIVSGSALIDRGLLNMTDSDTAVETFLSSANDGQNIHLPQHLVYLAEQWTVDVAVTHATSVFYTDRNETYPPLVFKNTDVSITSPSNLISQNKPKNTYCHYGPENSACATFDTPFLFAAAKRFIELVYKDVTDLSLDCNQVSENVVCPIRFGIGANEGC